MKLNAMFFAVIFVFGFQLEARELVLDCENPKNDSDSAVCSRAQSQSCYVAVREAITELGQQLSGGHSVSMSDFKKDSKDVFSANTWILFEGILSNEVHWVVEMKPTWGCIVSKVYKE